MNGKIRKRQTTLKCSIRCVRALLVLGVAMSACATSPRQTAPPLQSDSPIPFRYHLQVIANEAYEHWTALKNPIRDAKAVSQILSAKYGYVVHPPVYNGKESDVYDAFDKLREELTEQDALLVYYSGHGHSDPQLQTSYWIPVDAGRSNRSAWIHADDIVKLLRPISARHVLVVADSCYSGKLFRSDEGVTTRLVSELAANRARKALTSGGDEPVEDGKPGGLSVFARFFVKVLTDNERNILRGTDLWLKVESLVVNNADQKPNYGVIRDLDDEGGDFLFVQPRRADAASPGPPPAARTTSDTTNVRDDDTLRLKVSPAADAPLQERPPSEALAPLLDSSAAAPIRPILSSLAETKVPPGATPVGEVLAAKLWQGQAMEVTMQMGPGRCYTVVGVGRAPEVTELDIKIVAITAIPNMAPILAVDNTSGPQAVLGEKPNCFKWAWPIPAPVKVVVTMSGGSGLVAAQVFAK